MVHSGSILVIFYRAIFSFCIFVFIFFFAFVALSNNVRRKMTNGKEDGTEKLSYSCFNSQQLASREMDSTVSTRLVRLLVDQPSRSSPLFISCQRPLSVQGRTGFDTLRWEIFLKHKPNRY